MADEPKQDGAEPAAPKPDAGKPAEAKPAAPGAKPAAAKPAAAAAAGGHAPPKPPPPMAATPWESDLTKLLKELGIYSERRHLAHSRLVGRPLMRDEIRVLVRTPKTAL